MAKTSDKLAKLNRWTRDLHLYFGLFVCPFLLIFAITTILLNHGVRPEVESEKSATTVNLDGVPEEELADSVLRQLDLSGETFARVLEEQNRLNLSVARPADNHFVRVDLETGAVQIERRVRNLTGVLIYLHFNPGPHKVKGVNWIFSKLWGWSVDVVICLVLFLTLSGVYLWLLIKGERKIGIVLLVGGVACFAAVVQGFF